ncbi:MAG TPA: TonB-dependent receptor [Ignavibacteriaceae bacterium]|nr:TonB-dependent receptor [Ignavibacteriaceae bacterium]
MYKKFLLLLFLIASFVINSLYAQSTGKIMGKVIDASTDEGIPFANVLIDGTSLGAASDVEGNFVILNIPPGLYNVTASYIGYQKVTIKDITVNVGFTTSLDFKLNPGEITLEAVVVQGDRNPLIRQDLTNPTVAITSESLENLPVDNIADVIKLQAGVVTGDDGSIHVRGGYGNEVAYTLNGLSLNDPYGNSRSVGLASNAVQEASVSTGTFSAEFGNALSGVVNYVTKEGSDKYTFSIRGYGGDYVTSRTDFFTNLDKIDVLNRARMEATFGGPLPISSSTQFFASGIYENFKGGYYGYRLYNPGDSYLTPANFKNTDPRYGDATGAYFFNPFTPGSDGTPTGDKKYVPMNPKQTLNLQFNISQKFGSLIKLKYEFVYDRAKSKDFNRNYLFNPDGLGWDYSRGVINTLDLTHTVDDKTFYTLKGSYSFNRAEHYLYENPEDARYLPNFYRKTVGNTTYYSGGTDNDIWHRSTETYSIKGDLVSQMFGVHEVKAGFEFRKHNIKRDGFTLDFYKLKDIGGITSITPLNINDVLYDSSLTIIRGGIFSVSTYDKNPLQGAVYLLDKMELAKTLILNIGLRYEFFDAASEYNYDFSKNLTDSLSGYMNAHLKPAEIKHMLSPRFSVSYPITDRGVIRFSYGHFYQIGSLSSLYSNDLRWVPNVAFIPTFGNPNVNPQRSVQYEIGLQQQLTDDFKFDLTGYYKDVRDYIFTQTIYTEQARQYKVLTNLAYSNVRGITLSFLKRRGPGELFSATLDYTFQVAEGNRTEPQEDLFFSEASGKQTETYLVPLDFDRPHLINGTFTLTDPNSWSLGVIYNIQAGTPYTPALPPSLSTITYQQNSGSKSMQWEVDLKFEKYFSFGPLNYSVFIHINNLFDTQNDRYVYASSGKSLSNIEEVLNANQFNDLRNRINRGDPGLIDKSFIDNYYTRRPENVSRPREVRLGFSIIFN